VGRHCRGTRRRGDDGGLHRLRGANAGAAGSCAGSPAALLRWIESCTLSFSSSAVLNTFGASFAVGIL